jgi:hypothetical protein
MRVSVALGQSINGSGSLFGIFVVVDQQHRTTQMLPLETDRMHTIDVSPVD